MNCSRALVRFAQILAGLLVGSSLFVSVATPSTLTADQSKAHIGETATGPEIVAKAAG